MRISDWSSDVCSSDLMMPKDDPAWMTKIREFRSMLEKHMAEEENEIFPKLRAQLSDEENKSVTIAIDRKSVVSGKSVSVRVDLGGRRIHKNKNSKSGSDNSRLRDLLNQHKTMKKQERNI